MELKITDRIKGYLPKGAQVIAIGEKDRDSNSKNKSRYKYDTKVIYEFNGEICSTIIKGCFGTRVRWTNGEDDGW